VSPSLVLVLLVVAAAAVAVAAVDVFHLIEVVLVDVLVDVLAWVSCLLAGTLRKLLSTSAWFATFWLLVL